MGTNNNTGAEQRSMLGKVSLWNIWMTTLFLPWHCRSKEQKNNKQSSFSEIAEINMERGTMQVNFCAEPLRFCMPQA